MMNARNETEQKILEVCSPEMLKEAWRYAICACVCFGMSVGILGGALIAFLIGLHELDPRDSGLLSILGLSVLLGGSGGWTLGRTLLQRVTWLMWCTESFGMSLFCMKISAIATMVFFMN